MQDARCVCERVENVWCLYLLSSCVFAVLECVHERFRQVATIYWYYNGIFSEVYIIYDFMCCGKIRLWAHVNLSTNTIPAL